MYFEWWNTHRREMDWIFICLLLQSNDFWREENWFLKSDKNVILKIFSLTFFLRLWIIYDFTAQNLIFLLAKEWVCEWSDVCIEFCFVPQQQQRMEISRCHINLSKLSVLCAMRVFVWIGECDNVSVEMVELERLPCTMSAPIAIGVCAWMHVSTNQCVLNVILSDGHFRT